MNNIEKLENMINGFDMEREIKVQLINQLGAIAKDFNNLLNEIEALENRNRNQELYLKEKECSVSMLKSMISGIIDNY